LNGVSLIPVLIETSGDRDKMTPLEGVTAQDFFTDAIERALLKKRIDAAIHSAKDIDSGGDARLMIAAITASINPYDCLVSREGAALDALPLGARIGTSSLARKEGILKYRKDLTVGDIRGNVDNRLQQLDHGAFDAIIVAEAALIRLGLESRISWRIPEKIIQPHPLQGRLAIQVRKERRDLKKVFEGLHEH